jgi:hypothetical protein
MPEKPLRSISVASSIVALRRPGTAARLNAGILVMSFSKIILKRVYTKDSNEPNHSYNLFFS